ncbi:DUF1499 domain-containing protein [Ensifer soli]|uniref:DUF1499 domain-containing protein n=1 Tax=Ciceribacter sp. sgz301302 TaxID=3342379 RepID=UPI0035B738EF
MIRYERPHSRSASLARILARLACAIFLVALGLHRFGALPTAQFLGIAIGTALIAATACLLAVVGLVRLWQVAAKGGRASLAALLYAAPPLAFAGFFLAAFLLRPAIHDVSSDTADPPAWVVPPLAVAATTPASLAADHAAQAQAYPELIGRRYDGGLDRVLSDLRQVAQENGVVLRKAEESTDGPAQPPAGTPASEAGEPLPDTVPVPSARPVLPGDLAAIGQPREALLQGEWRTPLVGLRYDVVFRLREDAETTLVDMRIAPRFGRHGLGLGADFAGRFLRALDAKLLGIAGD